MYRFKIPDRWVEYAPFGETVADTRIIAVKTPLEQIFRRSEMVPDGLLAEQMFTPTQLVDGLLDRFHLLSLVIDLTNTTRYYDPKELQERGIDHVKIKCPGQTIPPDSVYKQFCSELERWLQQAKTAEVVAVHCTHGVNRTGYLVCRYMMESKGFTYKAAVAAFNEARKHSIENQEYLDHLERGCPPLPEPPLPPPPTPQVPSRDTLPPNTDSQPPSLPDSADNDMPSRKRPRCGESTGGYPEQQAGHSSPRQLPKWDHHQAEYHRLDGGRQTDYAYGYHDNPYGDQSHCGPSHQWCLPWKHEAHHQWEPPRKSSKGQHSRNHTSKRS